jgi:hypothetical protein
VSDGSILQFSERALDFLPFRLQPRDFCRNGQADFFDPFDSFKQGLSDFPIVSEPSHIDINQIGKSTRPLVYSRSRLGWRGEGQGKLEQLSSCEAKTEVFPTTGWQRDVCLHGGRSQTIDEMLSPQRAANSIIDIVKFLLPESSTRSCVRIKLRCNLLADSEPCDRSGEYRACGADQTAGEAFSLFDQTGERGETASHRCRNGGMQQRQHCGAETNEDKNYKPQGALCHGETMASEHLGRKGRIACAHIDRGWLG